MIPSSPSSEAFTDWKHSLRQAWRDPTALLNALDLQQLAPAIDESSRFPFLVTREFAARMQPGDPADPLLRQVLPALAERRSVPGFGIDPVGDLASRRNPGMLHKYRGRVLLITTGACPIHCRYCFRREYDYASDRLDRDQLAWIRDYIAGDASIGEVILSGGDPLTLGDSRLRRITDMLRPIPHLRRLRIHSRMPVTLPSRVDPGLIDWLEDLPWQRVMVIHANHAREFDGEVADALARLRQAGAWVFNQAVLLAGVNDCEDALADLMETGFAHGAAPYYLHLLDRVAGSAEFEVDETRAVELMRALRLRLPGFLVPRLVREQAGAPYKVPLL
jgi:EF-P beta-lysylation protein EpmB